MKLSIGFSPCPNDTFIFDALVNNKIDKGSLKLEVALTDVETLNEWASEGRLDITKLSFPAFFEHSARYALLDAGSALGQGVGPLLVSKTPNHLEPEEINQCDIVLPGKLTTAHFLFSYAFPGANRKVFMPFNEIEEYVLLHDAIRPTLGVIIHESRFTYQDKGLFRQADLGEYWEKQMKLPVPLGGIGIKRDLDLAAAKKINRLIVESLAYAFNHYPTLPSYVVEHAQEMSVQVMRQHIELYVNNYSTDLGPQGRGAITVLHEVYRRLHPVEKFHAPLFAIH